MYKGRCKRRKLIAIALSLVLCLSSVVPGVFAKSATSAKKATTNNMKREEPSAEDDIMPMSVGDNIYLNGVSGVDSNDGLTPGTAVGSFARAYQLAKDNAPCSIYITGTVTVSSAEVWDMGDTGTGVTNTVSISRCPASANSGTAFTGAAVMVNSGASFDMQHVHWDEGDLSAANSFCIGAYGTATVSVDDCSFLHINNKATAASDSRRGGLFYGAATSTINMKSSTVDGCQAYFGGMLLTYGKLSIDDCKISNCTANSSHGGAIYLGGGGTLTKLSDTTFDNCTSTNGNGGVLHAENSTSTTAAITHCTMTDCTSNNAGGALYLRTACVLTDCEFEGCQVLSTANNQNGGAVMSVGNLTFAGDTKFTRCSAGGSGGAVYATANLDVTGSFHMTHCKSLSNTGGGIRCQGEFKVSDCTDFVASNCQALAGQGGAIYANKTTTIDADNISFKNCSATDTGGAMTCNGAAVIKGDLSVEDCSATKAAGGIRCNSTLTISDSTKVSFTNCTSDISEGGGMYVGGVASITADNINFSSCEAGNDGGGLSCNSNITLNGTVVFDHNSSGRNGGGLCADGQVILTGPSAKFTDNTATSGSGGGICSLGTGLDITGTKATFTGNKAINGGGIYASGNTTKISHATFTNNEATTGQGGGIYANKEITIKDTTIDQCIAKSAGGGILANGTDVVIQGVTITNCTSGQNGGGVHSASSGSIVLGGPNAEDKVSIRDCSAEGIGGGYATSGTASLDATNVNVSGCSSKSNGGGAYLNNRGDIVLKDSTYDQCNAANVGGAILFNNAAGSASGATISIDGSTFSGNVSDGRGGALAINTAKLIDITDTDITNNRAKAYDGGGIYAVTSSADISLSAGTNVTGNSCATNSYGGGVGGVKNYQLHVSGLVNVKDNNNGNGEANIGINNNESQLTTYQNIVVDGALDASSYLGANPMGNINTLLIAVPGDGYDITESDLKCFYHDRLTRGDATALPIVFDNSHTNLILYGSRYTIHYVYDGKVKESETQIHTGKSEDMPITPKQDEVYGYETTVEVTYQDQAHPEQSTPLPIPSNDSLLIQVKYTPKTYNVSFAVADSTIGELTGDSSDQSVQYLHKPDNVLGQKLKDGVDADTYYFIGWLFETKIENKDGTTATKRGITMYYDRVPIEGDTTFTAQYAKVPFISVLTPEHGSVSIAPDTTPKPIVDGTTFDTYEWPENQVQTTYNGIASFKANPHYHVSGIRVIIPSEDGRETTLDLTNGGLQSLNSTESCSAKLVGCDALSLEDMTYGNVQLTGLAKSAQVVVEFERDEEYNVRFVSDPSQYATTTPDAFYETMRDKGEKLGAINSMVKEQPRYEGYHLVGWSKTPVSPYDPTVTSPSFDQYDSNEYISGDIVYYAIWERDTDFEYAVEVLLGTPQDDGTLKYVLSTDDSIYHNAGTLGEVITLPVPLKVITGYEYNSTKSETSGVVTDPGAEESDELILHVYYDPVKVNVTYQFNDGHTPDAVSNQYYGTPLKQSPDPKRAGYKFLGWYAEAGFVNLVDVNGMATAPSSDTTLYARWQVTYCDLKISKTVSGQYADRKKQFTFTIKDTDIDEGESFEYTTNDGTTGTITFDENHTATFKLRHGENVTILELPGNTNCQVTESDNSTYNVAYKLDDGGQSNLEHSGDPITVPLSGSESTLAVTNIKDTIIPSAVLDTIMPWIYLCGVGLVGCVFYVIYRRRRRDS